MKRKELLEQMKHNMVTHLEDLKAEEEKGGYEVSGIVEDIELVKTATTFEPIFTAMCEWGWDVPGAIMFVVKCAIEDPEDLRVGDADIPMHWST